MDKCYKCQTAVKTRTIRFSVEGDLVEVIQCKECWMPITAKYIVISTHDKKRSTFNAEEAMRSLFGGRIRG